MKNNHNTNYTYQQVESILLGIKDCVQRGRYSISLNSNRKDNLDFIAKYKLQQKDQKKILLGIKTEDFCYALPNEHRGYEHEILYVFVPEVNLIDAFGKDRKVAVYVKFNFIHDNDYTVVVSFHELHFPIDYLFK